jgi:hypothetical protein
MKHTLLIFVGSLLFLIGCVESTKKSNNTNICATNPYAVGCYSQNPGTTVGGTVGGTTGVYDPGNNSCYMSPQAYYGMQGCPGFCMYYPAHASCLGSTTGSTVGGTTGTYPGTNPYPNYYSGYVDKNWMVHYPYVPSISCSDATAPSGIDYTPHETRKGTITLKGQVNYDPASGQQFFDTTSDLLQTTTKAKQFFWADSTLKVRFKANIQPESRNTTTVCPGRVSGMSTLKGYGKIKFNLHLVGTRANGTTETVSLGTQEVKVNSCTSALNLSTYAAQYPNGIYLKVSNVYGNQNWMPGNNYQQQVYDTYGYVTPQNPSVEGTWGLIRNAECWSLDVEVAADGTKTF